MVKEGFRFGMLLQMAVGVVSIYIFNISVNCGLQQGFAGVAGVVLVDALFIYMSIIGMTAVLGKNEKIIRLSGTIILLGFGAMTVYKAINQPVNAAEIQTSVSAGSTFIKAVVITGANPLTIIFWSGIFAAKIVEEKYTGKDELLFGLGALISTMVTLSAVVLAGQVVKSFISSVVIKILNVAVGIILIYFGVRLFSPVILRAKPVRISLLEGSRQETGAEKLHLTRHPEGESP